MKAARITTVLLLLIALVACGGKSSPSKAPASVLHAALVSSLPTEPPDAAWERIPGQVVLLQPQNLVPPHLENPSVTRLEVRVLYDGSKIAFQLRWADPTRSNQTLTSQFADAVAVQLPVELQGELPEPTMGQAGKPVAISFWRASWQAEVDGRPHTLRSLYPNAWLDTTPPQAVPPGPGREEAELRYQVARSAGNPLTTSGGKRSVVDLTAQGFGTMVAGSQQISSGRGIWQKGAWTVVITRPLAMPAGGTYAAFAVWEGEQKNVGARKMRSNWLPLRLKE